MAKKDLINLLSNGYFPDELPPPFTTGSFSELVSSSLTKYRKVDRSAGNKWTAHCRHNLARHGRIKRVVAILNPKHFFRLADLIQSNWPVISSFIKKSSITQTEPVWNDGNGRAIVRKSGFDDRPKKRAVICQTARSLLITDVERFFPSIYTHSIPWAMLGKSRAKSLMAKNKLSSELSDKLDKEVRSGQSGQTIGIPIGPDTSRVIAEIILSAVDQSLPTKLSKTAMRFVDDYEFACSSFEEAGEAFTSFYEALSTYELSPNLRKTHTLSLPAALESPWVGVLRDARLEGTVGTKAEYRRLQRFFELAIALSSQNLNESVIKYAIKVLAGLKNIGRKHWKYVVDQMCSLAVNDPSCLEDFLSLLQRFVNRGYPIYKPILRRTLNEIIDREMSLRHSSYVCWAIWGCLVFDLKVLNSNVKKLAESEDVAIALMTLHARSKGLLGGSHHRFVNWEAAMRADALDDEMWLLSYEARIKGWLPSKGVANHLKQHKYFRYLAQHDVYFYDVAAVDQWRQEKREPQRRPGVFETHASV